MIKWLLDTNACIAIMNQNPVSVIEELKKHSVDSVAISVISLYELRYGVYKSRQVEQNKKTLAAFLQYIQVIDWTDECADTAGEIRTVLEKRGKLIGPYDMLIAAHAKCLNFTLVSHNTKEFSRVNGLALADWVK